MSKILIDTNIMIYSINEESIFYEASRNLLNNSEHSFFISSKNVSEFLAVVTKKIKQPLSVTKALEIIENFLTFSTLIYPNNFSFFFFQVLLRKYNPKGLKIYDFEIASIALSNGINQIATINKKDFKQIDEIELVNLS
ncbi:MAG: PIN domain-containing protein [Calditrichaeota bacterium]|nr:MAG: PIN domain-containing protein [Calditrichota bacterium]